LKLTGLRCLLVGGGEEAERRAAALVDAGARLRVASQKPTSGLRRMAADGDLALAMRGFEEQDLEDVWLVVLTDPDPQLATTIAAAAAKQRVFFCAVDQPEHSTFYHPAVARSGPVIVAVSTSGAAPALSRRLREELERVLNDAEVGAFVEGLVALRSKTPSAERKTVLGEAVANVRLGALELSPIAPVVVKKED
jgi:siroheme synthase-like protein